MIERALPVVIFDHGSIRIHEKQVSVEIFRGQVRLNGGSLRCGKDVGVGKFTGVQGLVTGAELAFDRCIEADASRGSEIGDFQ